MILIALALMASLALVAGLSGPVAAGELGSGRQAFLGVEVRRAARGAMADWVEGPWIDSTLGRTPGEVVAFPDHRSAAGVELTRRAECLAPELWLLEVTAQRRDQAGRPLAAFRAGWLVRTGVPPRDSMRRFRPTSRFSVRGFQ